MQRSVLINRKSLMFVLLLGLGATSFLEGQALAALDAPPPPPSWVDRETGVADLAEMPDSLPVLDQDGNRVGSIAIDKSPEGWEFRLDADLRTPVRAEDGSVVGFMIRLDNQPNAPYRFVALERIAEFGPTSIGR